MPLSLLHYRAECDGSLYTRFLNSLLQELALDERRDEILDGVQELPGEHGPVHLALDRKGLFAAARWHAAPNEDANEAFFVCPQSKPPQVGLSTSDSQRAQWLIELTGAQPTPEPSTPSYAQLRSTLLAEGAVPLHSPHFRRRVDELSAEVEYLKALLREQGDELRRARAALRDDGSPEPVRAADGQDTETTALPTDLRDLVDWSVENEANIVVLPRARSGAKKSLYRDPGLIFVALALLAGPYRDHRLGLISRSEFEAKMLPTGLRLEFSVAPSVAGEQGDAYFVAWAGRRRFLDSHLLKGGGRDERYCLRIYFFWDEESKRVVVGDLPRHLSNSLS